MQTFNNPNTQGSSSESSLPSLSLDIWLGDVRAQRLLKTLRDAHIHGRFVGGCVRDGLSAHIMTEPDIDIAVNAHPQDVKKVLAKAQIKTIDTGLKHGTITAFIDGKSFEITSLRVDVKTDGRHAEVLYTQDWTLDAQRRDFTINALYADGDGQIFDPLHGYDDLRKGVVRFIGDAHARIEQDYLRILRFFRFTAIYGNIESPHASSLHACKKMASGLSRLSGERIRDELFKILSLSQNITTIKLMKRLGILDHLFSVPLHLEAFTQVAQCLSDQCLPKDPLLLAAVLWGGDSIDAFAECLKLSEKQHKRIREFYQSQDDIQCYASFREVRRFLYKMGKQCFRDRVLLLCSQDPHKSNAVRWNTLLAMTDSWTRPIMPINGSHVRDFRITEGPLIGYILKEVENWWIDSDFPDDIPSSFERLRAIANTFRKHLS